MRQHSEIMRKSKYRRFGRMTLAGACPMPSTKWLAAQTVARPEPGIFPVLCYQHNPSSLCRRARELCHQDKRDQPAVLKIGVRRQAERLCALR